jgi:hypothetical protein
MMKKKRIAAQRQVKTHFSYLSIILTTLIIFSCQSQTAPNKSITLEFGTCLGELNTLTSCSSQIFRPLQRGSIGCWIVESNTSSFRAMMNWDGDRLSLADQLDLVDFTFSEGDMVDMQLILFDSVQTASLCGDIMTSMSCEDTLGCVTKLNRPNTPLSFTESIGFRDDFGQCFVDTPQINAIELCNDGVDGDCDGVMDEGCVMPGECEPEDRRICENACGQSEQVCIDGNYTSCRMPADEVCSDLSAAVERIDEDCDGVIDEGCGACNEGETMVCTTQCGDGVERCLNGAFQDCDAPTPVEEACGDGEDNDCDEIIDEGCGECVDGDTRACFSDCGSGLERCNNGFFTACNAPSPIPEICNDELDNDCDQNIDEGCPDCIPSGEVCDGLDNDCDMNVDEGTNANQACLATRTGCAGQVPGFIICDMSGAQRCFPNESLFTSGAEVCDGVDNNCDGRIDNILELGNSCRGEADPTCAYSRLTCMPNELGVVQDLICQATLPPDEICDGIDNNCNGIIDEVNLGNQNCMATCNRAGVERCVTGQIICEALEPLPEELCDGVDNNCNDEIDEGCPVCEATESICNGIDDDCNGSIDEGVCGPLIYNHCEARLGWWYKEDNETDNSVPNPPWRQWPPSMGQTAYCPSDDDVDEDEYSCDVARAGSGFQTITIEADPVTPRHWLGIGWACEPSATLSAAETAIVTWAHTHCHIGLGYRDVFGRDQLNALTPMRCPQSSPYPGNREARCIQTQAMGGYSAIELEGEVNWDDIFGIVFYCDGVSPPNEIDGTILSQNIQTNFQVFFGVDQRGNPYNDGTNTWGSLPDDLVDDSNRVRGVGSRQDGAWSIFDLDRSLDSGHRLSIGTRSR